MHTPRAAQCPALLIAWFTAFVCHAQTTETPADSPDDPLATLIVGHPRVLATADVFAQLRHHIANDARADAWYAALREQGEAMLNDPVVRHHLRDGRRLLWESRGLRNRALTLGLLHQIEPDDRYVQRVWQDLQAAAAFPDWNPAHFLDTAEMACGFGVAYDWLHDDWTPGQRRTLQDAIVRHALRPGLDAYARPNRGWVGGTNNWNQVCNGGLLVAALAIADADPNTTATARAVVRSAIDSLPRAMALYNPDGAFVEGPGYWNYGTGYNVLALTALQNALGHTFSLLDTPGFDRTAEFPIDLTAPSGLYFNFADGGERRPASPAHFQLARWFDQPAYAQFAYHRGEPTPLGLLGFDPDLLDRLADGRPLAARYPTAGVGVLRSSWTDPNAWFVAAKAGQNGHSHGHLDLGSFVLETQDVRWFIDPGGEDYNLLRHARSRKWDFYRLRAEGHNTLVLNPPPAGPDQPLNAAGQVAVHNDPDADAATITLTLDEVYGTPWTRTLTLDPIADTTRVTDTLAGETPIDLWWFAHTRAAITLDDDSRAATLTRNGRTLRAVLLEPADARFEALPARPLPTSPDPQGQNPNNGARKLNNAAGAGFVPLGDTPRYGDPDPARAIRKLAIHLPNTTAPRVVVEFHPAD